MKNIKNIFLLHLLGTALVLFSSCGEDDQGLSIDEKLSGTWRLSSVTIDASDVTSDFSGFNLSFNSNGPGSNGGYYSANNGGGLLVSGSYYIMESASITFTEDSGLSEFSATLVLSNNDKTATISFYNPTTIFGEGRIEGVAGDYVFVLNK